MGPAPIDGLSAIGSLGRSYRVWDALEFQPGHHENVTGLDRRAGDPQGHDALPPDPRQAEPAITVGRERLREPRDRCRQDHFAGTSPDIARFDDWREVLAGGRQDLVGGDGGAGHRATLQVEDPALDRDVIPDELQRHVGSGLRLVQKDPAGPYRGTTAAIKGKVRTCGRTCRRIAPDVIPLRAVDEDFEPAVGPARRRGFRPTRRPGVRDPDEGYGPNEIDRGARKRLPIRVEHAAARGGSDRRTWACRFARLRGRRADRSSTGCRPGRVWAPAGPEAARRSPGGRGRAAACRSG